MVRPDRQLTLWPENPPKKKVKERRVRRAEKKRERRPRRPPGFPGAIWIKGKWFIPMPRPVEEGGCNEIDVEEYLKRRVAPISTVHLANLMGFSRFYVYKAVTGGQFPEGSVLKHAGGYTIKPSAALSFYRAHLYDPRE